MRQLLKAHLRAAPIREHKVELGSYLRRADAGEILARMARARGTTESDILADLTQVRSVELYMPVRAQRETWIGDTDVLVAAQLVEHDPIMAFDKAGNEVAMDESGPPTQPTIVIVGTETRFNQPLLAANSRNTNDRNGQAIGTLIREEPQTSALVECGSDCSGGGGGGSVVIPVPGLYLEFSRIVDAKEPWIRGEPEVEVHIHGATSENEPNIMDDRSCSGAEQWGDPRKRFDQNDGFWSGSVLLFTASELGAMPSLLDYHIIYWEDDNEACVLKLDSNVLRSYLLATLRAAGSAAVNLKYGWPTAISVFIASWYNSAGEWMLTNDDYIGDAIFQTPPGVYTPSGIFYYPDNTHVIVDEDRVNGRANIVWH
jgi:hypothetical protein